MEKDKEKILEFFRVHGSLVPGRNQVALNDQQKRRIEDCFRALGYEGKIEFDEGHSTITRFSLKDGHGIIIVGSDIFPGGDVVNANSTMDYTPAIAHEITHYNNWDNGTHVDNPMLEEAITSLQAICRYKGNLMPFHIEQLVSDALERLNAYVKEIKKENKKCH